jgi:hypothetical protein
MGNDERRPPCPERLTGCADPTLVHDGARPRKQQLVRRPIDEKHLT